MTKELVVSLFAWWALVILTLHQTAASSASASSQVSTPAHVEKPLSTSQQAPHRNGSHERRGKLTAKQKWHLDQVTSVPSRATAETPGRSGSQSWSSEGDLSPLCAYHLIENGINGQLCFRHTLREYKCQKGQCRTVVSFGKLVANVFVNGSVLLQWTEGDETALKTESNRTNGNNTIKESGTNLTAAAFVGGQLHRRVGFELSCWWNGSYTQFECTGVKLARGCRDFLLTELHENIPYRICLLSLSTSTHGSQDRDCVEFTLPPAGMQDIVIAMTTVGGAICVMLVIICLLVAYITENIMSPTSTHTYPYRTHSHH